MRQRALLCLLVLALVASGCSHEHVLAPVDDEDAFVDPLDGRTFFKVKHNVRRTMRFASPDYFSQALIDGVLVASARGRYRVYESMNRLRFTGTVTNVEDQHGYTELREPFDLELIVGF